MGLSTDFLLCEEEAGVLGVPFFILSSLTMYINDSRLSRSVLSALQAVLTIDSALPEMSRLNGWGQVYLNLYFEISKLLI